MVAPHRQLEVERVIAGGAVGLPLVDALSTVRSRAASRITWHAHPNFELLLLLDGNTAYEFAGHGGVELSGGQFLLVPPRTRHRGLYDVRRPVALCGIVFDPRRVKGVANTPFTRRDLNWIARQCDSHALVPFGMNADLRRLVSSLAQQTRAFAADRALAAARLRQTACAALMEAMRQTHVAQVDEHDEAVAAAIAHMNANFAERLSMVDLARTAEVSRARLFPLFKRATGMTPNDYLQRLRVAKASDMLRGGTRSVTEVALACGFNTSQYFSCVFAKYTGVTPTEFRVSKAAAAR